MTEAKEDQISDLNIQVEKHLRESMSILWALAVLEDTPHQIGEGVVSDLAFSVLDKLRTVDKSLCDIGIMMRES